MFYRPFDRSKGFEDAIMWTTGRQVSHAFLVKENKAVHTRVTPVFKFMAGWKFSPKRNVSALFKGHSSIPFVPLEFLTFFPLCICQASSTCQTNWSRLNSLCLGTKLPVGKSLLLYLVIKCIKEIWASSLKTNFLGTRSAYLDANPFLKYPWCKVAILFQSSQAIFKLNFHSLLL